MQLFRLLWVAVIAITQHHKQTYKDTITILLWELRAVILPWFPASFVSIFILFYFFQKHFSRISPFPSFLPSPSWEMGIPGLLTALRDVTRYVHLSEFSGKTIAVDAYCWLHKAAFCCAQELCLGIPTDKYHQTRLHQRTFLPAL